MQEADLNTLGQLFEKAGDGTDEGEWKVRFEGFVKNAMAEHATRLKKGESDAEKKAEAFRAKFSLFGIVEERLNARCEEKELGISEAMKALQEAQGRLFQQLVDAVAKSPDTLSTHTFTERTLQSQNRTSAESPTSQTAINSSPYGDSLEPLTLQVDFEDLSSPDLPEQDVISLQSATSMSPNRVEVVKELKKYNSYAKRHQKTKPLVSFSGQEAKDLSLPQLMSFIALVYQSKADCDSKADPDNIQTMEMHFYTYIAQHYGMHAVKEWASAIFNAIKKFSDNEVRVAAFGKILQNRLPEDFPRTLESLNKKLQDSFKEKIEESNPQESVEMLWQASLLGRDRFGLHLSDYSDIVLHLYNHDDGREVMKRLQQECKKYTSDANNTCSLPPDCIRLQDLCQVVCLFQMTLTENFLADFIAMFNAVSGESHQEKGSAECLERGQLTELVRRLSHMQGLSHAQAAPLLEAREKATSHVLRVQRATFSQCVSMFSDLISARWGAAQSDPTT